MFIFHLFICRITVSENVVKINKHRKEWTNPIRIIRSRDYLITELSSSMHE